MGDLLRFFKKQVSENIMKSFMLVCEDNTDPKSRWSKIVKVLERNAYRGFWPVKGFDEQGSWVKCYRVKCRSGLSSRRQ